MKSVDTNVLARFALGDDPVQAALAAEALEGPCFASNTVLLETAWLLSSRYKLDRQTVAGTLDDLLRLPQLSVSDPDGLTWAINRFAAGADFADMMHILSSEGADCFLSFEKRLARQAGPDTPLPIEILA